MPSVGLLRPAVVGPCVLGVMLLVLGGAAPGDVATDVGTRGGSSPTCTFATAAEPGGEALIGGMVLADRGGDGALDPADGDTPVAGAPVVLTGTSACGCPVEERTSTGPDGRYAFPVPAGTYRVVAPQPPGFDDGPDVPGSGSTVDGNDAFLVEVPAGGTSDGNSFAELPRSGLGGSVFDDADGNGTRAGTERGIADLQVTLTGTDEAGNPVRLTTTTAGDGVYVFPRLRPGEYDLTAEHPPGFPGVTAVPGTSGGSPAGPTAITGIRLGRDTTGTGYDFAAARPAGLAGSVLDDAGRGVADVPVVVSGRTPAGTAVERETSTAADGSWAVADLPAGTYTVRVPLPPGFGDGPDTPGSAGGTPSGPNSIAGIRLDGGEQADGYVFTVAMAAITGHVFVDVDGDGSRDSAEPGLAAVAMTLSGTDVVGRPVDRETATGPDGAYRLDGLLAGTYSITQAQPAGYGDGVDSPGSAGGTPTAPDTIEGITPTGGSVAAGYDFGERGAELAGLVADQDGVGLPGLAVTVTGTDVAGAPVDHATSTGPDGTWAVIGLPAGSYTVSADRPPGHGGGPATPGTAGGAPVDADSISGVALGPGERATGYRFVRTLASIAGSVYLDRDRDGVKDPGEAGVGAATVQLTGTDVTGADVDRTVTTDASGTYRVDRLLAGEYRISEVGTDEFAGAPDQSGEVTVPAGESVRGPDAAVHGATLSGRVVDEAGAGVPGLTVSASGSSVRGRAVEGSATTTADGSFGVSDLPAGHYTLTAEQPPGHGDGPDEPGAAGGAASGANSISGIGLAPGQDADGYRFTTTFASIGGSVFSDLNGDGTRGGDEPAIADVVVTVAGTDATGAAVERRVTTDGDGGYLVDRLLAGSYTVTETPPPGYVGGTAQPGTAGGVAAGPDTITDVELPGGADARGYDFHERCGCPVAASAAPPP